MRMSKYYMIMNHIIYLIKNDRDKVVAAINYDKDYKFLGSKDRIIFSE